MPPQWRFTTWLHYLQVVFLFGNAQWEPFLFTYLILLMQEYPGNYALDLKKNISPFICVPFFKKNLYIFPGDTHSTSTKTSATKNTNSFQKGSYYVILYNHHCPFISPPQTRPAISRGFPMWHRGPGWAFLIPIGYRSWVGTLPAFVFIVDELCPTAPGVLLCCFWLVGGRKLPMPCFPLKKYTLSYKH